MHEPLTPRSLPAPRAAMPARDAPARAANPAWHRMATAVPVSQPSDPDEIEAERVADAVMRGDSRAAPALHPADGAGPLQRARGPRGDEPLQRPPDGADSEPAVDDFGDPGTGRPLDPSARRFFEPRFGQDFGDVRVHDDARAARAAHGVAAEAFTRGRDITFGPDRYAPQTAGGRRLLAHELAHVVQQRSRPVAAGTPLARQPWGSAQTTAPPAKNESPGDVFRGQLKSEVALFANASVILDWIVAERAGTGGATVVSFATSRLFADAATMKKIKPKPAAEADLLPALQMLEYYGVLTPKGSTDWNITLAPLQPGQIQPEVARAKFDQNRQDIGAFQKSFETRFDADGHPIKQIAQQDLLEDSFAAGADVEWKAQHDAENQVTAVAAELDEFVALRKTGKPVFRVTTDSPARTSVGGKTRVLLPVAGQKTPTSIDEADFDHIEPVRTGTSPEVQARRKDIEKRSGNADRGLYDAQGFHRFATEMVWFLHQLDKTSAIKFHAGTYPRHGKFGEYAADMYPTINENSAGFYKVAQAEQFVDDINKVAEAGHPNWGKFAWQIVYNDTGLQATINAKYGAPRMSSAPHHGPSPDKLHMHLDIRPLSVAFDSKTGFTVNASGRVVLL